MFTLALIGLGLAVIGAFAVTDEMARISSEEAREDDAYGVPNGDVPTIPNGFHGVSNSREGQPYHGEQ